jgi:parvulin-like peptidyl-prolyl isomerase
MNTLRAILLLSGLGLTAAAAEVLDRVAVSAGQQVVTLSAILRQLRLETLASGEPVQDTGENRRRAASRLIDQAIVLRELELSRYTPPSMAEAEAAIERYLKQSGRTRARLLDEVAKLGFSEDDFKREMQWRVSVSRFIDYRFAAGVQVADEEVEKYYRDEYTAQYRKLNPGAPVPPLDEVRDSALRIVTTRKTNAAMEQWLTRMRESLRVTWFPDAFKVGGQQQ